MYTDITIMCCSLHLSMPMPGLGERQCKEAFRKGLSEGWFDEVFTAGTITDSCSDCSISSYSIYVLHMSHISSTYMY